MKKRLAILGMTAAMMMASTMTAFAGWQQNQTGWWYTHDEGNYPVNCWQWLDGNKDGVAECYCFDGNGYMYANTVTPDNFTVDASGAWTVNGVVQTKAIQWDDAVNGGLFSDMNDLTWKRNDGSLLHIGRGKVFSDEHPGVTDPLYLLNEITQKPGTPGVEYNSKGQPKANYGQDAYDELKKFVESFDWIHSDELTRYQKINDRISNGFHGNYYGSPKGGFSVLLHGVGVCGTFSNEFQALCEIVGVECVLYQPSDMHQACLIKIGNQWMATDPTSTLTFLSNAKTHPVDYETEYHRYSKEFAAKQQAYADENPDKPSVIIAKLNAQLKAGEISDAQYDAKIMELYGHLFK